MLEPPLLYTRAFVRRTEAVVRGLLRGASRPVGLATLARSAAQLGVPETLASKCISAMLAETALGSLHKYASLLGISLSLILFTCGLVSCSNVLFSSLSLHPSQLTAKLCAEALLFQKCTRGLARRLSSNFSAPIST